MVTTEATRIREVLTELVQVRSPGALNLYDERACVAAGDRPGQATVRLEALSTYLTSHWRAGTVLVGEAPGMHGARLTGVPFTSMRTLNGTGVAEPSATIVQGALAALRVEQQVVLWNASMLFPPGNRNPTAGELHACRELLGLVTRGRTVYAVGRHAQAATGAPYLRHPAHGGASAFRAGMEAIFRSSGTGLPR
jgi:uracil-DNA glycosylase